MPRNAHQKFTDDELIMFIHKYKIEHQYGPSVREIAENFDVSTSAIHLRVKDLVEADLLQQPEKKGLARALKVTNAGLKLATERL